MGSMRAARIAGLHQAGGATAVTGRRIPVVTLFVPFGKAVAASGEATRYVRQ